MIDRNFRFTQIGIIEVILRDIVFVSGGGIDQPVRIHKGKLVQPQKLFHTGLVRHHVFTVRQVLFGHQRNRRCKCLRLLLKVMFHDLFTAAGKFIKIQITDRTHRRLGILLCALSHPERCHKHYERQDNRTDDSDQRCPIFSDFIHVIPSSLYESDL